VSGSTGGALHDSDPVVPALFLHGLNLSIAKTVVVWKVQSIPKLAVGGVELEVDFHVTLLCLGRDSNNIPERVGAVVDAADVQELANGGRGRKRRTDNAVAAACSRPRQCSGSPVVAQT
jgi:hypothetical protein